MQRPHPATERARDTSALTRRQYVRSIGSVGALPLIGTADAEPAGYPPPSDAAESGERDDFVWVTDQNWRDERARANLFAFASRHDLAVVIPVLAANFDAVAGQFRRTLRQATAADLDVWLRVGLLSELTAAEFVDDRDARASHLDRLRRVCRVYDDLTDEGKVVLWEEAPVMGQWVEGGEWNDAAVENMIEYGPRIFDAQRGAVSDAVPDRDVGIFVHFPYVVDSKRPGVFSTLADRLAERDARPDFAFLDFYRSWYEKDAGPELADEAVRSLITNAGQALDGNPVFYLAQAHTINPNHTPSKQAIRSNLRASIDAGADGLGWYARTEYVPTEQGFDPFVPNEAGAAFESPVGTGTVARDRYLYAWLSTLATRPGFDADDRFDLWLWGVDLSFRDHRLTARTADGWTFLGDLDGYADGEYPYGGGPDGTVSVVRALRRDRFLAGDGLDLRLRTDDEGDGGTLRAVLAMPCDPDAYVAEHEAASLLAGDAAVDEYVLGSNRDEVPLVPGETRRLTVPVRTLDPRSLHALQHPDAVDAVQQLRAVDERAEVHPRDRFDLWVHGRGLSDPAAAPSLVDRTGTPRSPADASVVALSTDDVALYYGLERDRFLADGLTLATDPDDEAAVTAAHAMPYAGSANFRPPSRAAALLSEQPDEVETFSIERVDGG